MESVGKILYEARISKGISLETAEKATSIRKKYLEAVEHDDYAKTPGDVFVKGMIRNYGNYLGLDGLELVNMYKAAKAGIVVEEVKSEGIREVENVKLNISLKQQKNWGSGNGSRSFTFSAKQFAAGAVVLLILLGGYFAAPLAMDMFTAPNKEAAQTENLSENLPVPTMPAAKADKITVEMTANDKCWLEVTADGKEVFVAMLNSGDKKAFEAKEKLIIKYGNIGAMELVVNGTPVSVAGEKGVAVKTYTK